MLPSLLAFLTTDSRLSFLFCDGDQCCFPWIRQVFLNVLTPTTEDVETKSLTALQLFLQKEKALLGMHKGIIMRDKGGK